MSDTPIRIATRGSQLAMWQSRYVADLLRQASRSRVVELVEISTVGDRNRQDPLSQMGGMGVFTREVQQAVLDGRADVAVHSLKDLPTIPVPGLALAGVPPRAPRFDVLLLPGRRKATSLDELPQQAKIGTGSLRRRAQLLFHRPDLQFEEARGNLDTRIRKLDEGQFDAILLAQAGLERLGWTDRVSLVLEPPLLYPAVGQAAIGIESRADDLEVQALLRAISCPVTMREVTVERACLSELRAGCHAPVGVWARMPSSELATATGTRPHLLVDAVVLDPAGQVRIHSRMEGDADDAENLGRGIAQKLMQSGAREMLQ